MTKETTISKNIRAADGKAEYDAACKCLLSEKMVLAWIMKSCLPEYLDLDIDEIATKYIDGEPEVARENSINSYSITEKNVIGNVRENPLHYDLLSVIMICLSNDLENQATGVLQLLNVLLSSVISPDEKKQILQHNFNIPMTRELEKEVLRMGSLADVLEEKAMAKGMATGMAKGMATGGKIIKLHNQGMSSEDIAVFLHLDLATVKDVIAECENE